MRYADAGVNISLADEAKRRIRRLASRTSRRGVIGGIGAFGALYALDKKRWREPVLVSSADGVGTKLKVACAMGIHETVGADLVNHCVNDILTLGAEPLFFLDYLALGKMDPDIVEQIMEGISGACHRAGCSLVGGETAEMPGYVRGRRIRSCRIHRRSRGAQPVEARAPAQGRRTFCSRCLPQGCTRTDIRWRGSWCSMSRASIHTPTSRKSGTRSAQNSCCPIGAIGRCSSASSRRNGFRAWRTSPEAESPAICRACFRAGRKP